MRLWNDYEGLTIEGDLSGTLIPCNLVIDQLLRPEGRSAFFSARKGSSKPVVLRLIESIHDDDEILDRWRAVSSLNHPNLVALKTFGQTVLDGEPLLYAVMEPTDISLAEILRERPLSLDETRELAASLIPAIQALHAANFVHEHIDPANILATDDTIKLRGDCVRDIPPHHTASETHALHARDVHDLALVLLRGLTQQGSLAELDRNTRLPEPFNQIIHNGVSGAWGLSQIAASLSPATAPVAAAHIPTPGPDSKPVSVPAAAESSARDVPVLANTPAMAPATPYQAASVRPTRRPVAPPAENYSPVAVAASIPPSPQSLAQSLAESFDEPEPDDLSPVGAVLRSKPFWLVAGAAALILLSLGWHGHHTSNPAIQPEASIPSGQPAAAPAPATKPSAAITHTHAASTVRSSAPAPASASTPHTSLAQQWRVIAFTYNRQDQAQHKADQIAQRHRGLRPEVFTPTGRAPYLVTLGGGMSREQAFAFRDKARGEGLPHDIYAQNYNAR